MGRGQVDHHSLLLLNGQGNPKQDHLQVLQSDHPHKDSSKDPNSLEPQEGHQHDLQQDLLVLHQDFQCSTQQPSEFIVYGSNLITPACVADGANVLFQNPDDPA